MHRSNTLSVDPHHTLQCCGQSFLAVKLSLSAWAGHTQRGTLEEYWKLPGVCSEWGKEWWRDHLAEKHITALSQCLPCRQPLQTNYFLWSLKRGGNIGFLRTAITPEWHHLSASKGAVQNMETLSDLASHHWASPRAVAAGMKSTLQVPCLINRYRQEKILWNLKDLNSNVLAEASFYLSNAFGLQLSKVQKGLEWPWITFAQDDACTPSAQKAIQVI